MLLSLLYFSPVYEISFGREITAIFPTGRNLPVNSRMTSGNIFLNMSVDCPDQMGKLFNSFIKSTIWPFIEPVTFRIINNKTIKMAPVIIKIFNEIGQFIKIL